MSYYWIGFYWVVLDKFGDGGIKVGLWIFKCVIVFIFVKGNVLVIFMWFGFIIMLYKFGEIKVDIGRDVGVYFE